MRDVYKRAGRQGPNDPWYYDLTDPITGKRHRISTRTNNKAAAILVMQRAERKLLDPSFAELDAKTRAAQKVTGGDVLDLYLTGYGRKLALKKISPSTYEIANDKCKPLRLYMPRLATEWNLAAFEKYIDQRIADGCQAITIKMELAHARAALVLAKSKDMYFRDVAKEVPRIPGGHTAKDRVLLPEELRALVDTIVAPPHKMGARKNNDEECRANRYAAVVYFVITGCRASELQRAKLEHVRLATHEVYIEGSKTAKAKRWVTIAPEWAHLLEAVVWQATSMGVEPNQPMFPHARGIAQVLRRAAIKAGVPHVSPNDLRRTFATWLLAKGTPESAVWRLMGHTSGEMLAKHYGKLTTNMLRELVNGSYSSVAPSGVQPTVAQLQAQLAAAQAELAALRATPPLLPPTTCT